MKEVGLVGGRSCWLITIGFSMISLMSDDIIIGKSDDPGLGTGNINVIISEVLSMVLA